MVFDHEKLMVWQKAIKRVSEIYQISQKFPKEETYGLTSQIRRAAISVPSNIAEGKGRYTAGEFRQFLIQARGSLAELETQIVIAGELGYLKTRQVDELKARTMEVGKMINGLIDAIARRK